jgi:hypothetical protein
MKARVLRLLLGLFFLVVGVGLLILQFGMPEAAARLDPIRLFLGAIFAFVLAALNLARWYAGVLEFQRLSTPVRRPFQRDPDAVKEEAPNSEFDFSKKEGPPK